MIPKGTSEKLGKEKEERKPVRGDDKQVTDEGSWDYIPLGPLRVCIRVVLHQKGKEAGMFIPLIR